MLQLPDTPIASPEQDLFSLSPFAQRLARVVRATQVRDNIVIGLNGAWGSGKTSAINMTVAWLMAMERAGLDRFAGSSADEREALSTLLISTDPDSHAEYLAALEQSWGNEASGGQTIILRYDPWLLSGHETLVSDFFRLMGERIDHVIGDEAGALIRARANQMADLMDLTHLSSSGVGRLLALSAGQSDGGPVARGVKTPASSLFKGLFRREGGSELPATLREAQARLNSALKTLSPLNTRVLAIVDNIDRLKPDEIRAILSMLKAAGDLTGVTYLIACDRTEIAAALGEQGGGRNGAPSFLEKIVQVDLDMPRIPGERLLDLIGAQAGEIFGLTLDETEIKNLAETFGRRRSLLHTPRDVARLRNALTFTDATTGRSIRTTDLIRLEMIRLKERDVYDWIIANALAFHPRMGASISGRPGGARAFVEEGLSLAAANNREAVADALCGTFGNIADALGRNDMSTPDRLHPLDTRFPLYSWEGWESYLQSFPDADIIAPEEWLYVGQICADLPKSRAYVQTLVSRRRADGKALLLSFLESITHLVPGEGVEPTGLINALFELSDELVGDGFGLTHRSALRELHHLLALCERPGDVLLWLIVREGVNPFAVVVLLEVFAEQLGMMSKNKNRGRSILHEDDMVEAISTVYLRIGTVPPDRVARWFATVELYKLLSLGLDKRSLYQFGQKVLAKSPDEMRYFLLDVCSNWPSRNGIVHVLVRRPDSEIYPLEEMRNYAIRMNRKYPGDVFFSDFITACDDFIANPALRDRTPQLKAHYQNSDD